MIINDTCATVENNILLTKSTQNPVTNEISNGVQIVQSKEEVRTELKNQSDSQKYSNLHCSEKIENILVESKGAQQTVTEQNSTFISRNTLQTSKILPCSSKVILNEGNKLDTEITFHNLRIIPAMEMSLCSNARTEQTTRQNEKEDKDQDASSTLMNHSLLVPLNPVISTVTKVTVDAKTQNKNESVATIEQKSTKVSTNFNNTCHTALGNTKMESTIVDNSESFAVTSLETNLTKSGASSILSEISAGRDEKHQCISNESLAPPLQRLSLENDTAAEAESCSSKLLENIEEKTTKSESISPCGSSTLQENERLEKIVENQLVSSRSKEGDFNERDCSLTDLVAVNIPYILQKLDNDLGNSTKAASLLENKQMDSSEIIKINISNNTGSSQAFAPFSWVSVNSDTKQQEHLQMQIINPITQPLDKLLIQTEIKKSYNRKSPIVSYVCKQDDNSYPTDPLINPSAEEVVKVSKPAAKRKISGKSIFASRKRRRRENCLTNSLALEPMNNKLPMEDIPLEERIIIMNSGKNLLQKTVSLNIDKNVHPTTTTVNESVPAAEKMLSVQRSICSVGAQSVPENTSMYKPVTGAINSKKSTDNLDSRTLKVISLSENLSALNLVDTTDNSIPLSKSTEGNLINVKQTTTLDTNNSNETTPPPLLIYSHSKQPLYTLERLDKYESTVGLSNQQLNSPMQCVSATTTNYQLIGATGIQTMYKPILNSYNLYPIPYQPENISLPIKTGVRCTMIRCNTNQIRPGEIKIAPKTSTETAVSGNSTSVQYIKLLNSGTNAQPVNNVNVCPNNPKKVMSSFTPLNPISSLTPISSNHQLPCPPLQPLADQTKPKIPVLRPVPKYPDIKIVDVRTDAVNKSVLRSASEIVQIKSPEATSAGISKKTNAPVRIQAPEIKVTSKPKSTTDVQTPSSKMNTLNHDSDSSEVKCNNTDVGSPNVETIDQAPRMFQLEVQVPQTMSETTQEQQKSNSSLAEQKNVTSTAARDLSNLIIGRETMKQNKATSEKRKLMLLEKEAMHKRRIDMLQHVFKVLNHCASMCAVEDFQIWFKKEEPPQAQSEGAKEDKEKQKVPHVVTEKPGEWVGMLKVLRVQPINEEDQTPKRKRSLKTVAARKSRQKRPEVMLNNSAQKRKSNEDQSATLVELPGKLSKIRKSKRNDSVTEKSSSSSTVSPKGSFENLQLSATREQEVDFTTYHDQKENDDKLAQGRERLDNDKSNDTQTGANVESQKRKPGRPRKLNSQKKPVTPVIRRGRRGKPRRKWITESPEKGESDFIFSHNVIVKSENIEVTPNMSYYDAWNDQQFCQVFGIRECYIRLRRVEELYPLGYNCIDFDSIFS